jgi:hypothetical protein
MVDVGRRVRVVVAGEPDADTDEIAQLVDWLRAEMVEHDFDPVPDPAVASPTGAKAGDPAAVSSVLIALAASGGVLTSLIGLLQGWLQRGRACSVVVEIDGDRLELVDPTPQERRLLTEAWLSRHERAHERAPDGLTAGDGVTG